MTKFDICLMNPPYDRSLHLKFLEKTIQVSENVVSIQPVRWLEDYNENNNIIKYKNSIIDYIYDIELITNDKAREIFNAGINTSLGIYICNEIGGFNINKLKSNLITKILNKLNNNVKSVLEKNKYDGWRIKFPTIVGGSHTKDNKRDIIKAISNLLYFYDGYKDNKLWYNFYNKNQNTKEVQEIPFSIKFNTEQECINFINSLKTKFILYVILQTTKNTTINLSCIPYMDDYTRVWTDKNFYEYFDISDKEQKIINEEIKNFRRTQ